MSDIEVVTMADFRAACEERLDHAVAKKEHGLRITPMTGRNEGKEIQSFETPAGLQISRALGMLTVRCDMSELGDDADQRSLVINFGEDEVFDVTETVQGRSFDSRTLPRREYDRVAGELAKFVNLIP